MAAVLTDPALMRNFADHFVELAGHIWPWPRGAGRVHRAIRLIVLVRIARADVLNDFRAHPEWALVMPARDYEGDDDTDGK